MKIVNKQALDSSEKGLKQTPNGGKNMEDNDDEKIESMPIQTSTKDQRPGVNYEQYLRPKTDRVYEFQTKRIDFRRRQSFRHNIAVILHFEGVIGDILQKNIGDDNY